MLAQDIWAQIHFKENSIPSVHAGRLTDETKHQLHQAIMDIVGEDEMQGRDLASEADALRRNNLRAEIRSKLADFFGEEK